MKRMFKLFLLGTALMMSACSTATPSTPTSDNGGNPGQGYNVNALRNKLENIYAACGGLVWNDFKYSIDPNSTFSLVLNVNCDGDTFVTEVHKDKSKVFLFNSNHPNHEVNGVYYDFDLESKQSNPDDLFDCTTYTPTEGNADLYNKAKTSAQNIVFNYSPLNEMDKSSKSISFERVTNNLARLNYISDSDSMYQEVHLEFNPFTYYPETATMVTRFSSTVTEVTFEYKYDDLNAKIDLPTNIVRTPLATLWANSRNLINYENGSFTWNYTSFSKPSVTSNINYMFDYHYEIGNNSKYFTIQKTDLSGNPISEKEEVYYYGGKTYVVTDMGKMKVDNDFNYRIFPSSASLSDDELNAIELTSANPDTYMYSNASGNSKTEYTFVTDSDNYVVSFTMQVSQNDVVIKSSYWELYNIGSTTPKGFFDEAIDFTTVFDTAIRSLRIANKMSVRINNDMGSNKFYDEYIVDYDLSDENVELFHITPRSNYDQYLRYNKLTGERVQYAKNASGDYLEFTLNEEEYEACIKPYRDVITPLINEVCQQNSDELKFSWALKGSSRLTDNGSFYYEEGRYVDIGGTYQEPYITFASGRRFTNDEFYSIYLNPIEGIEFPTVA